MGAARSYKLVTLLHSSLVPIYFPHKIIPYIPGPELLKMLRIIHSCTLPDSPELGGVSGKQSQSGVTVANKSPPPAHTTTNVTATVVERFHAGTVIVPGRVQLNDNPNMNEVNRVDAPPSNIHTAVEVLLELAKRSTILHHTYLCGPHLVYETDLDVKESTIDLFVIRRSRIEHSGDLSGVYLEVLISGRFGKGINIESVRELVTTPRIMSSSITNPARDIPTDFKFQKFGASSVLSFREGPCIANVVMFGMVAQSDLIHGRSYPVGLSKHVVKSVDVIPIVREDTPGGTCMSTSTCSSSASPRLRPAQSSFSRHQLAGTDTVPIYNSTNHILADKRIISAEVILTQRERPWLGEIPLGTFVAVHGTVSLRKNGMNTSKYIIFNLKSVQILALSL
ncbi:hypothetical protein PENSPDRAFT_668820 [Peniophora sp. CONT]|nr:hypothetical protein PENSPDRAFT_668820 [Peniophora sp. CONT]